MDEALQATLTALPIADAMEALQVLQARVFPHNAWHHGLARQTTASVDSGAAQVARMGGLYALGCKTEPNSSERVNVYISPVRMSPEMLLDLGKWAVCMHGAMSNQDVSAVAAQFDAAFSGSDDNDDDIAADPA